MTDIPDEAVAVLFKIMRPESMEGKTSHLVGWFRTEQEAHEANASIGGTMGHPRSHGGDIYRVTFKTTGQDVERVWGPVFKWKGQHLGWHAMGWQDGREKPRRCDGCNEGCWHD